MRLQTLVPSTRRYGGEADAEQLGAPLERGRDRAGQGIDTIMTQGVVGFPGLHVR
jgi:hypothetical protein